MIKHEPPLHVTDLLQRRFAADYLKRINYLVPLSRQYFRFICLRIKSKWKLFIKVCQS